MSAVVLTERPVEFTHGAIVLAGTVVVPAAPGAHAAMVLMPGSGSQTRDPLLDIARYFAQHGIVSLVYDKQGTGHSAGSWLNEDLDDLAGDANAAIGRLRTLPEVDPATIGAWAISQSGWVLPRLATQFPQLRFALCVTGGGATPREVEYLGYDNELAHAGFGPDDRAAAKLLVDRYMEFLASGKDREALLDALRRSRGERWSSLLDLEHVLPDTATRSKWAWVPTYDPIADIQSMHIPVFVAIGGRDPFVPATSAMTRWLQALAVAGNPNDVVIAYPTAGHGIRTNGHDMNVAPEYAPGYLANQIAWLQSIGVLR